MPIAAAAGGFLLLIAAALAYLGGSASPAAAVDHQPDDVITDRPIFAVHEMAQGAPIPFLPRNEPQPDLVLLEDQYDFGSIGPKDVVERTFIVHNDGAGTLTISRAYTTCGCTTAEISASVIPPGKAATVRVIFNAGFHDVSGQVVRRGIILENNDPGQPQAEIWVQAAVRGG
jgi:hypothetical protein